MQIQSTPRHHDAPTETELTSSPLPKSGGHRKGTGSNKAAPERTCIVTRETKSPDDMIRFALSPDGIVVPDLKGNLPGRGVWVTATADMVKQAIAAKAFARGFKTKVTVDANLSAVIHEALLTRALQALGLARKAGAVITGFAKVDSALRSSELSLLVTASDAAQDGQEKLKRVARAVADPALKCIEVANSEQLSMALGLEHVIHAGVIKGQSARAVLDCALRLIEYRGSSELNSDEHAATEAP